MKLVLAEKPSVAQSLDKIWYTVQQEKSYDRNA